MARPSKDEEVQRALQLNPEQMTRTGSVFNANQIQLLYNSTKPKYKYKRPGRGGGQWDYVRAGYVRRQLDSLFGFNWDFVIETSIEEALNVALKTGTVVVKGYIVGRILDHKFNPVAEIRKGDAGRAEVKFLSDKNDPDGKKRDSHGNALLLDFGNDVKAASTDCFKRCAARFGIAADVYDPDEFMEIAVVGSDEHTDRAKNQQNLIDKAKAELESGSEKVGGENGK